MSYSASREPTSSAAPSTDAWIERDAAAVWHPFTQHSTWVADEPTLVASAEGPWLIDLDGNRYLDGVSSLWVTTVGHCHPDINAAVKEQLDTLDHSTFLGTTHRPGIELAEALIDIAPQGEGPQLTKVFYAGDGSSAMEVALKMSYQYSTQTGHSRPKFVRLTSAYHGDTLGAVSAGGIDLFHQTYRPLLLQTIAAPSPGERHEGIDQDDHVAACTEELGRIMAEHGSEVCAIVLEPLMQGAAGMLNYPASYLQAARRLATEHGALLVCDEVATGIGRTGRMWSVEHAGIVPDLLACGKGITGGYLPLSAVLAAQHVWEGFLADGSTTPRTFFHGHTYTANPLCCAAALANLRIMREQDVVGQAAALGERLGELLAPLRDHPGVKEIRRHGTMIGVEVVDRGPRTGFEVCQAVRGHGVWLRPLGNTVIVMPPLNLGEDETELLAGALIKGIDEVLT
ncbi:adenosylmethionine--8-amino-7-oxononanoate transaminase [Natronoglycomyces albus]|uniref:Adenosylmethionine-8-amino-7-oxononanoate aminotransferase n=1 Tax=Natronoglycomyces albus TaxID=2811108 RepID=A0A895XRG4_9ACTN|nr:adenosylmethionine--8-amino-7-oxononanoate transaminase [Natronoglycomyces albus]QSB06302.1 adenosylmethionine--8-amino-7-oxononanoate transaminase [Natronoglycomyces albus]